MYNKLKLVFVSLFSIAILLSCKKELSVERGYDLGTQGGTSVFTLDGAPGECVEAEVEGIYSEGVVMTQDNFAVVYVDVTETGTYTIRTNRINGILFEAADSFSTTGRQQIVIYAVGTPLDGGTFTYLPGFNACSFDVNFEPKFEEEENVVVNNSTAVFTFNGYPNACASPEYGAGDYFRGTPLDSNIHTVTLKVNVSKVGTYNITTSVYGMQFKASGSFSDTGANQIIFKGTGTPTLSGDISFSTGATTGCSFKIPVKPAGNTGGGGGGGGGTGSGVDSSGTAVYRFLGAGGSCTDADNYTGTYKQGTALDSNVNTVILSVMVDSAGTYHIATTKSGMTFTTWGTFDKSQEGTEQKIIFKGSGTPTSSGNINFQTSKTAAASCYFTIPVEANSPPPPSGNFYIRAKIDGVLTNFNNNVGGYYVTPPSSGIPYGITVRGQNSDITGSKEELWVGVSDGKALTTGIYNNGSIFSPATDRRCAVYLYPAGFGSSNTFFWGAGAFNANTLTVTITSISVGNQNSVAGTFTGLIYEQNGGGPATKQLTEGEFNVTFN